MTSSKREPKTDLTSQPAYRLAFEDVEFLNRDLLRPVRLQLELLKPTILQDQQGIRSTIVLFGSARIPEPEEARQRIETAREKLRQDPDNSELVWGLSVAEQLGKQSGYYEEARAFASLVSRVCQKSDEADYVIVTGGGPGIMEAGNRGAWDVHAKNIGLNITLPHEQAPNPYITPELCFLFRYFAIRKMQFLLRAKALVAFPGGFGTLDELFDALTLVQTKRMEPLPIILCGRQFWEQAVNFDFLVQQGTISREDKGLMTYAETAEEIWAQICEFYGHSELIPG